MDELKNRHETRRVGPVTLVAIDYLQLIEGGEGITAPTRPISRLAWKSAWYSPQWRREPWTR